MFRPPTDTQDRPLVDQPTWRGLLVSYALVVALPVLLWVVSHPLAGTVALTGIACLVVGSRRAYSLIRCFYDCQGFTVDVGSTAQITVRQLSTDDAC